MASEKSIKLFYYFFFLLSKAKSPSERYALVYITSGLGNGLGERARQGAGFIFSRVVRESEVIGLMCVCVAKKFFADF